MQVSKFFRTVIVNLTALTAVSAFAHGEQEKGPHGGHIRMPGAFHTELVPISDSVVRVYLLDIEWKNPKTENSNLKCFFKQGEKKFDVNCKPVDDSFECALPKGQAFKSGSELEIFANRDGLTGAAASYAFPLPKLK